MAVVPIIPPNQPAPMAPYSPAVKVGETVYVSGVLSLTPQGQCLGVGDARAQTRQVLETIRETLAAAGGTLADVAFNHVFVKSMADYAAVNEVYREFFPKNPPARYCIQAELVRPEFLVEIASIAHVSGAQPFEGADSPGGGAGT